MNYFIKCMKQYADFKGRARRKEFWMFFLFLIIILYGFMGLAAALKMPALAMVGMVGYLVCFIPYLAVAVRRMHDCGKSGWFILIPIYNLVLFCTEGNKGPNEYGEDPKAEGVDFDFNK
jgi:uncharacterized membrane protein YhaH (DUF805 family)